MHHPANDRSWPFPAPGLFNLDVRFVPEAEVNLEVLNVRYRESRYTKFYDRTSLTHTPLTIRDKLKPCKYFASLYSHFLFPY